MKNMSKFFFVLMFLAVSTKLTAQLETYSSAITALEKTTGAPNAGTISKYFEVPVNMSNGTANIQIPVYTIKSGNITLPISLSYHTGGIKVNDPVSWVGAGWSLNTGGIISKKINGLDDEYAGIQPTPGTPMINPQSYQAPYYSPYPFTNMTQAVDSAMSSTFTPGPTELDMLDRFFGQVILNQFDGEADEYFYSTPEGSGTLVFNQQTGFFMNSNINNWRYTGVGDADPGASWLLESGSGNEYTFASQEITRTGYDNISSYNPSTQQYHFYVSAWHLSQVKDKIHNKTVSFNYDATPFHTTMEGYSGALDFAYNTGTYTYVAGQTNTDYRLGNDLSVSEITFEEGKVQFIKDVNARLDMPGAPNALKEIRVLDHNNNLKKKFVLSYFYYSNRLFLSSVREVNYLNGDTTAMPAYKFDYNISQSLPARFSYAQDVYGYYNGKTTNTSIYPAPQGYSVSYTFSDRSIDTNYTRLGTLKQVKYPTGGTLNIETENNRDAVELVGGLRIKRIINTDSVTGKQLVTEYKYQFENGAPSGALLYKPKFYYDYTYMGCGTSEESRIKVVGSSIHPLSANQGSAISYDEVEKSEIGDSYNLKSRHSFVNYLNVGAETPNSAHLGDPNGVPFPKMTNLNNYNGIEYSTKVYQYKNGQYYKINETQKDYKTLNQFQKYIWNVQAAWGGFTHAFIYDACNGNPYNWDPMFPRPLINPYKFFSETLVENSTTSETKDDNNNTLTQFARKEYDHTNGNLKKTITVNSKGDTLRTYYKYSCDYPWTSSTNPVNVELVYLAEQNIILPVEIISTIQKAGSATETVRQGQLYTYTNGRVKKLYQFTKEIALAGMLQSYVNNSGFYYDANYQQEEEINTYNSDNNPVEITSRAQKKSFIWDKNNIMASAADASYTDIAATSFEPDAKGNWSYSGTPVADVNSITGKNSYNLSTGNITKSGLSNTVYHITYWSSGAAKNVNASAGTAIKTRGSWTLYQHEVTNPSGGTITVSGTGNIDELRVYPKKALINTLTYEPLIGITSQTDANNNTVYYEYDGFGRLKLIRDKDNNILKKYCYNYAGQQEDCVVCNETNSSPIWQNTGNVRCQVNSSTCAYTGYQEIEQQNTNPCSPATTQWITGSYNPGVCGSSGLTQVSVANNAAVAGLYVKYTSVNNPSEVYIFPIPSTSGALGCLPGGKSKPYNIQIYHTGLISTVVYTIGATTVSGTPANFSNVWIGPLTSTITIDPNL